MAAGNQQLQVRAGSNVPTRIFQSALARAQVPVVHLDDSLGDQLIIECPAGELLFTSGPAVPALDLGMGLGTSGPGLSGEIFLVDAQGQESSFAPVTVAGPPSALSPLSYGGSSFGSVALSPGEKFIYRPAAVTNGKGFLALQLYFAEHGPGAVQQSVVDLADGVVHALLAAPPGKSIQVLPFGVFAPGIGGVSVTTSSDVGTTLDVFLNDEGVDYKILSGFGLGGGLLSPLGTVLFASALLTLSPGQSLRAQRVGAAANVKVRSVFQMFNVEGP